MATRNHYVVLGVPRGESRAGIRAAFRDLVKRHHPDRSRAEDANRFREVVEAYRVLEDPETRRAYDEDLRRQEQDETVRIRRRRPVAGGWVEPEPLVSQPLDVFGAPEEVRPSLDALFERMLRNFTGRGVPKAERPEAITCEVLLTPEEARRGGVLPIRFPAFEPCAACGGTGDTMLFPCLDCSASGIVEVPATVRIRIPPRVASGSRFTASLSGMGIRNLVLEVLIRVGR
jgi:DnaJ-class molecular chaperone